MAKKIVRYLLEGDGKVPAFVEDGGYFEQNNELVGRSVDESIRHIPLSVMRMTRLDLYSRIQAMHEESPGVFKLKPNSEEAYTAADIEAMTQAFLDKLELSDYA